MLTAHILRQKNLCGNRCVWEKYERGNVWAGKSLGARALSAQLFFAQHFYDKVQKNGMKMPWTTFFYKNCRP